MVVCGTLNNIECVLEYNNLILYKLLVMGILLIYSLYTIYKYKDSNWLKIKKDKSNFDFMKEFISYSISNIYVLFLPFILILLRNSIDFELFLTILASMYTIGIVVFLGLSILFLEKFVSVLFNKETVNTYRERTKYGQKK